MIKSLLIIAVVVVLAYSAYKGISGSLLGQEGYFQSKTNTLDAQRRRDIGEIANALSAYSAGNSSEYPADLNLLAVMGYLKSVPSDPSGEGQYVYRVSSNRRSSSVHAVLETKGILCWSSIFGISQVSSAVQCRP